VQLLLRLHRNERSTQGVQERIPLPRVRKDQEMNDVLSVSYDVATNTAQNFVATSRWLRWFYARQRLILAIDQTEWDELIVRRYQEQAIAASCAYEA
jgi:hypothetical protein